MGSKELRKEAAPTHANKQSTIQGEIKQDIKHDNTENDGAPSNKLQTNILVKEFKPSER